MTESGWAELQQRLLARYDVFKKRLTKYFGSADLAGEALQDTWLRLERGGELSTVQSLDNYLYTMAINHARNRIQADNRRLSAEEVDALFDVEDEAPTADRLVEGKSELQMLVGIIAELPERQRSILLAARVDGMNRQDIALRFGVSVRFVQRELHEAQVYCVERLRKLSDISFRSARREMSIDRKPVRRRVGGVIRKEIADE